MVDENLIKALRCIASVGTEGDCYMDYYNIANSDKSKHMYCNGRVFENDNIQCPFYQDKYDTCYQDGECSDWLYKIANILEKNKHVIRTDIVEM